MNKLEIMKQTSVETLLEEMIKHQPGITSQKLWETTKEWYGKLISPEMGIEFDLALGKLRENYRCTNRQWYTVGHTAPPKVHEGRAANPKQLRMDW
jgi:hypothetical protein